MPDALAPLFRDPTNLRQVWCVTYDSDTPNMDGSHNAVRMNEVASLESVQAALRVVADRSLRAPKRNLRIETRFVSDWSKEETTDE